MDKLKYLYRHLKVVLPLKKEKSEPKASGGKGANKTTPSKEVDDGKS